MNFLEELASEYYDHQGYFVKNNERVEIGKRGGYKTEMDVIAYHPTKKELIHLEATSEATHWEDKKRKDGKVDSGTKSRIKKKFNIAKRNYKKLFDFDFEHLKEIAIAGYGKGSNKSLGDIELKTIPQFKGEVLEYVRKFNNSSVRVIPEKYPLLRTIQEMIDVF